MMSDIYLPNTHGSIPAVIKVGDLCYEYQETIPRSSKKEDHCWSDVQQEYFDCDDCCFSNIEYIKCPDSSSTSASSSSSSIIIEPGFYYCFNMEGYDSTDGTCSGSLLWTLPTCDTSDIIYALNVCIFHPVQGQDVKATAVLTGPFDTAGECTCF